jgi:selenocysteine-specific elongation factor
MGTEDLELFEKGSLSDKIAALVKRSRFQGYGILQIEGWFNAELPEIASTIDRLVGKGILARSRGRLFHRESLEAFMCELKDVLNKYHLDNPLKSGMPKEELKAGLLPEGRGGDWIFDLVAGMDDIVLDKDIVRLKDFNVSLSSSGRGIRDKIFSILGREDFQPTFKPELARELGISEKEIGDILRLLAQEGALVRINDSMYITSGQHARMIELLKGFFAKKPEMGVAEFRDLLATSRKYSIPFLEYLDSNKITLRVGDIRKFMLK